MGMRRCVRRNDVQTCNLPLHILKMNKPKIGWHFLMRGERGWGLAKASRGKLYSNYIGRPLKWKEGRDKGRHGTEINGMGDCCLRRRVGFAFSLLGSVRPRAKLLFRIIIFGLLIKACANITTADGTEEEWAKSREENMIACLPAGIGNRSPPIITEKEFN